MAQSQSPDQDQNQGFNRLPIQADPAPRLLGRVRKLINGYGFVAGDDGTDYFFHRLAFKRTSKKQFNEIRQQDRLSFQPLTLADKGPRAIEVEFVEE